MKKVLLAGLTVVALGFAGSSEAVTIGFTFDNGPNPASGWVSFAPSSCTGVSTIDCEVAPLSDFTASFSLGGVTYTDAGYGDKRAGGTGNSIWMTDIGNDGLDWYWDDPYDGSNDPDFVFFDSGNLRLYFSEGDTGGRNYRVFGTDLDNVQVDIRGTYSANTVPEPTTMALLGGGLLGIAVRARRRRS